MERKWAERKKQEYLITIFFTEKEWVAYRTLQFSSVQSLSRIWLFVTPWTAAHQASLSITNSQSLLKLMYIKSVMPDAGKDRVSNANYFHTCCCLHTKSCPTFCTPMDCSPPSESVHGISQARMLEWVAIFSSRVSSQTRDQTHVFCIGRQIFYHWTTREAPLYILG